MPKKKRTTLPPPTVITLTLPQLGETGALLIQRGDLAHMSQFAYTVETDFTAVIQQALAALVTVERDPPVVPDAPPRKKAAQAASKTVPPEPMLEIPTKSKKGTTTIPARCLKVIGDATDDAAQQQALQIAGRLLDSGLWDGKMPVGIDDVVAVKRRLDRLSDKELSVLFKLEQFVTLNPDTESNVQENDKTPAPQDTESKEDSASNTPDVAPPSNEISDANETPVSPTTAQQPGLL